MYVHIARFELGLELNDYGTARPDGPGGPSIDGFEGQKYGMGQALAVQCSAHWQCSAVQYVLNH